MVAVKGKSGIYTRTLKTREKMRNTAIRIGRIPPSRKGVKLSEETKRKMSEANTGRKHSKETRKKMSISRKRETKMNDILNINTIIRRCYEYRQWRSDIFTRDNFTCQECGEKEKVSGKLNADHIKALSQILLEYNIKSLEEALNCEELWNINNGRTLCKKCHKETETYGGKVFSLLTKVNEKSFIVVSDDLLSSDVIHR